MPRRTILLLVTEPTMLSDILTDLIDDTQDLDLAEVLTDPTALTGRALETGAEVIVMCGPGPMLPPEAERLFEVVPEVRVISIDRGGAEAFLYRLEPTVRPLGELSPDGLVGAMRAAGRNPWAALHFKGARA